MSLTLYFHPLSSYCHKALIALYENDTPFAPHYLDLQDPEVRAAFRRIWPIGKMPVLRDEARGRTVPEASLIIEYLQEHHPGATRLLPDDPELRFAVRERDRLFDLYVHAPMQKIVGEYLRPEGKGDPYGVEEAKATMRTAYTLLDRDMATRTWAVGESFTLADCAAAPALFYGDRVLPFQDSHRHLAAYFGRLRERPSYARALREAEPYLKFFPG
ncbi:MAG: glutathione S-transferase family protein [Myxococcales bacterium]|nr:glutathione S-transferase family protein [Myxococcales bacterium]